MRAGTRRAGLLRPLAERVGLYPVGLAVAGPVAAAIGVTAVLVGGGLLSIPITLAGLFWHGVRATDQAAS
ncbi:MAG TPA: hypothetical protein VF486_23585 [Actinomycetes bacterium]